MKVKSENSKLAIKRKTRVKTTTEAAKLRDAIVSILEDSKGIDITVIDLEGKSNLADYMVIASGTVNRHVASMADNLMLQLKDMPLDFLSCEGLPQSDWVLVDAGDVIVHLFRDETRQLYNLEKMWSLALPEN